MESLRRLPRITMAFQPIVDVESRTVWGYEALVRGSDGAPAGAIFARVPRERLRHFEEICRRLAFRLASALWQPAMSECLSVNASPLHLIQGGFSVSRLEAIVRRFGLSPDNVIIELTEMDCISDLRELACVVAGLQKAGFRVAIDDFGSGHSGLLRLAAVPADYVKLDMELVRNIDKSPMKQGILDGVLQICRAIGSEPIAEGVESDREAAVLRAQGVRLLQGFHFAKPEINRLPGVCFDRMPRPTGSGRSARLEQQTASKNEFEHERLKPTQNYVVTS